MKSQTICIVPQLLVCGAIAFAVGENCIAQEAAFPLRDGERVVLIGDTLIESAQRYGYFETALLARFPEKRLVFRNLGWSADTVSGLSRAYFDPPHEGTRRLFEQLAAVRPTVLIAGYGMADSFSGVEGIAPFRAGLKALLEKTAGVRSVVLLAPIRHEDFGPPLPDPAEHNRLLRQYSQAIRDVASERGATFVSLLELGGSGPTDRPKPRLTSNGIHLTEGGYWLWALELERLLGLPPQPIGVALTADGKVLQAVGTTVSDVRATPNRLEFNQQDERLPTPPRPHPSAETVKHPQATETTLKVAGLAAGDYRLTIDDVPVCVASAERWAAGIVLENTPQHRQVEELRQQVIRKNRLYFQRYRPQNITYLLGFRSHEQGQNARELEILDRKVAAAETRIDALRKRVQRRIVLSRD